MIITMKSEIQVKTEVINKIQKWIKNKQFLNVPAFFDIDPNIKCVLCITYKGTGKTYSCMNQVLLDMRKGKPSAWIRNTKEEFKQSGVTASFNRYLHDMGIENNYKVRTDGIYTIDDKNNRFDLGRLKVQFSTMNNAFNTASQNSIEAEWIVYDEVINPDFHKAFLVRDFNNLVRTLQRTNNAKIIILGNAHQSSNDLINGLGVEFDWESGKTQVIYRQEQGLLALYIERYEISAIKQADISTDRLFMYSEQVRDFNEGKVANNNSWGVKNPLMIPYFNERFKPHWIYDILDGQQRISFAVGTIEAYANYPREKYLYVEQLFRDKYKDYNLTRLCYRPQDSNENNIYVYKTQDMNTVKTLINYHNTGLLLFTTDYGRDYFVTHLLSYLRLFLEEKDK